MTTTIDAQAHAVIEREVAQYNEGRSELAASVKRRRLLMVGSALGLGILLFLAGLGMQGDAASWMISIGLVGGLLGAVMAWWYADKPARDTQQAMRERIFPALFSMIDNLTYTFEQQPVCLPHLPAPAIGRYRNATFGDCIAGHFGGVEVELFEGKFTYKSGKSTHTSFQGVIVGFDLPQPFDGTLVANARRFKLFGSLFDSMGSMKVIETGNPVLDELYEIRTDNTGAAAQLVSGPFGPALISLSGEWQDNMPRVALSPHHGFVLLPSRKNYLDLPSIFVELDAGHHIEPLLGELLHLLDTALIVRKALER